MTEGGKRFKQWEIYIKQWKYEVRFPYGLLNEDHKKIKKEVGMTYYKKIGFFFILLLVSSCTTKNHSMLGKIKYFYDKELAIKYSDSTSRKLLILFTGYALSTRTFEELIFEDKEILTSLKENEVDILILNYDDKIKNNKDICNRIFKTDKWPVCGIVDSETKLVSNLCFENSKHNVKIELLEIIGSAK